MSESVATHRDSIILPCNLGAFENVPEASSEETLHVDVDALGHV